MAELPIVHNEKLTVVIPEDVLRVKSHSIADSDRLVEVAEGGASKMGRMIEGSLSRDHSEDVK